MYLAKVVKRKIFLKFKNSFKNWPYASYLSPEVGHKANGLHCQVSRMILKEF
jgi:hypothetical protein